MTKLRKTALLTVLMLMLSMFSGCKEKELSYTVLDIGSVSDGIGGIHTSDVPEWSSEKLNPHDDTTAPKEMTVTFNGKTYTGSYEGSYTRLPNTYVSHSYMGKLEDGNLVYFYVNGKTQELTSISLYRKTEQAGKTVDEAACRKVADELAGKYISLKDYKVKVDPFKDYDFIRYTYTYYREVSSYETTDMLRVVVDGNGVVTSCDMSMVGTFKDVKKISIDEGKATSVIEAKLQDIYGHLGTMTGYTVKQKQWVKTADDQCGRLYTIDVNFRDGNDLSGTVINLLIV